MTTIVPLPRTVMSVQGSDLEDLTHNDDNINDIVKKLENFEISYGYQSGGIVSYSDDERISTRQKFDEPTQHRNINQNTNNENTDNENTNDNANENTDNEDDMDDMDDIIETFNGSQIIKNEEMIIAIKSLCMGLLFVLISYNYLNKYINYVSDRFNTPPIIVKTILFTIMFYISEKYLL